MKDLIKLFFEPNIKMYYQSSLFTLLLITYLSLYIHYYLMKKLFK